MPFYQYEAEDQFGRAATGLLEAASPAALRDQLANTGFRLKSVRPAPDPTGGTPAANGSAVTTSGPAAAPSPAIPATNPGTVVGPNSPTHHRRGAGPAPVPIPAAGSVPPAGSTPAAASTPGRQVNSQHTLSLRAHALLFREFAAAFRAGMTAFQAADMIGGRFKSGPMSRLLGWVKNQAQQGGGFADALATSPVTLDSSSLGIIRAGERGGFLPYVLDELAASYEREQALHDRISPIKILYFGVVVPLLLLAWPLPGIVEGSAEANNNGVSSVGGDVVAGLQRYWQGVLHFSLPVGVGLLCLCIAWRFWTRTAGGRRCVDRMALWLPMWSGLQRALNRARFTRVLAHLYRGGIPVRESWLLATSGVPNTSLRARLQAQEAVVATGAPLSIAIGQSGLFGEDEVAMVTTGERTGEMDAMLFRLAQYDEETVERVSRGIPTVVRVLVLLGLAPLIVLAGYHFFAGYLGAILKWSDV